MTPYSTFAQDAFAGKTVMITGAASGMGLEASRAFASKQAQVVMCDLNADALERAANDLRQNGAAVHTCVMDVADQPSVDAAFAWCDTNLNSLDILVTCAAISSTKKIPDQDRALWRHVLEVNLLGTFFCVQAAIARMVKQPLGGSILCVASDAGVNGGGGLVVDTPYAASKAATLSLVKSVAREMAGRNVRINALNPGPTDSPFMDIISPDLKERIAASLPMRRMGRPSDMAAAILYICSADAPFVYGSAVDVNGGSIFR
ncbi:MAG: SDR family NAD(P)-dependent oxidoreductase [Tropicimonas sp.]|uniref:SDR family NAD(P)-dependent oxidoreductase n=1 Tax=Tropicimonas sp. TaxID=2067044 RepID=UPI003A8B27DF